MILEKLTVCGFSSYLEKQEIDLSRYYGGIFMITGDTGAGKTTVFDAVIYALFGKPSGSSRSEFTLHNISAGAQECYAELEFTVGAKRWTIHRSVRADSSDRRNNRCFLDSSGEHIDGRAGVDAKIAQILSLDHSAFCRISVLAQGEFARFLTMKSDERGKALRAVFDTEKYERYERYVDTLSKEASGELARLRGEYALLLNSQLSAVMGELSPELLSPERSSELCAEIERAERGLSVETDKSRAESGELQKRSGELSAQIEQLRAVNSRFDRLTEAKQELSAVEAERPEVEAASEKLARAEAALRVKPAAAAASEQQKRLLECEASLARAQETARQAQESLDSAQRELDEKPALTAEQKALSEAVPGLSAAADAWDENAKLNKRRAAAQAAADGCGKALEEARAEREAITKQLEELRGKISEAEKAAGRLPALTAAEENEQRTRSSCERLLESAGKIAKKRADAELQAKRAYEAAAARSKAQSEAFAAKESYFANLAGVLAAELTSGCACPVCGSTEHPRVACLPKNAATKEECDRLDEQAEQARSALAEAEKKYAAMQSDLDGRLESAAAEYAQLMGGAPENGDITLCTDMIEERRSQSAQRLEELSAQLAAAREGVELAGELSRDAKSLEGTLADAEKTLAAQDGALREAEAELSAAGALLAENEKQLEKGGGEQCDFPKSAQAAKQALAKAQTRAEELARLIPAIDERFNAADKEYAAAKSALEKELSAAETQRAAAQEKSRALLAAAAENGFLSPDEAARALLDESEAKRLKALTVSYAQRLSAARALVDGMTAELDGKERTDISGFEREYAELAEQVKRKAEETGQLSVKLEGLKKSRAAISARAEEFMSKTGSAALLERLGGIVGGKSDKGSQAGKISLERYVQGRMLDKVLVRANARLSELSGGRYRLMRVDTGERKSSAAGLDIMVEDLNAGKNALRPVASLSGGEEFLASFALAVGLSDYTMELNGGVSTGLLFVDEGFSSLDENTFSTAMNVINEISGENRTIGVVSHVREIRDRFPLSSQIIVKKGRKTSYIMNGTE